MNTFLHNTHLSATINSKGAELISLKTKENKEYIWEGNSAFWGKHSPILFPIIGTLKNNSYYYNNSEYQLSRHGFARDLEFTLCSKTDNSATFSLSASGETLGIYPFDFELQVSYTLVDKKLVIAYQVINKSKQLMPFSLGAHPAFALPKPFEHYSLEFEHTETLDSFELENDLLSDQSTTIQMNDRKVALTYSLFEKDALIFKKLQSKRITILENEKPLVQVEFNDFPNLGIWTKPEAHFLCIEPWIGYSDTIHSSGNLVEKEAIQLLEANKSFQCNFSINII